MAGPRDSTAGRGDGPRLARPGGALRGLTFFNPRAAEDAAALTQALLRHGATVIEQPMIEFVPPASWAAFDRRLAELAPGDWIAFTSATAVRFTLRRLRMLGREPPDLAVARLAAVGPGTAAALEEAGLAVSVTPEKTYQGEGLLAALKEQLRPGDRVWLPRAEEGRDTLAEGLRQHGVQVAVTPVYRTATPSQGLGPALDAIQNRRVDWFIFTSPSTAVNFFRLLPEELRSAVLRGDLAHPPPRVACLGQVTAWGARELGFRVHVVPQQQDVAGLVEAIVAMVRGGTSPAKNAGE
jgi:uroporphyrinogen-III synthase